MPEDTPTPDAIPIPSPTAPAEPLSMRAVLRIAPLRRLWYAQIVSTFGDFIALIAVVMFMTFVLKSRPQQITGIQIAYMLPIAVLGIVSGVFVDRWPIKTTLVTSDFLRGGLCLFLLVVHSQWGFYATLATISIVSSVFTPAQGVALRTIIPMHGMRSAQALMQQVMFIMRVIGAPLAAVAVKLLGYRACYIIDALSFIASGCLIASLVLNTSAPASAAPQPAAASAPAGGVAKILHDMREGLNFIVHHAALFFVIVAMAAAMFVMGCFGPLIAVYVRDILHASETTFGFANATIGVGLMIGINALNAAAKKLSNNTLIYGGLLGIAAGTALLSLIPHLAPALFALFLIGFAVGGIIVPSQTMIQQETPQHMLGRVGSTVMSLIFTAQILGLVLSGVLANHTSVRRVFALCAAMLIALAIAGKLWMEPEATTPTPAAA